MPWTVFTPSTDSLHSIIKDLHWRGMRWTKKSAHSQTKDLGAKAATHCNDAEELQY
jgi:hypothetical protein